LATWRELRKARTRAVRIGTVAIIGFLYRLARGRTIELLVMDWARTQILDFGL
jgi:hypothetical protein